MHSRTLAPAKAPQATADQYSGEGTGGTALTLARPASCASALTWGSCMGCTGPRVGVVCVVLWASIYTVVGGLCCWCWPTILAALAPLMSRLRRCRVRRCSPGGLGLVRPRGVLAPALHCSRCAAARVAQRPRASWRALLLWGGPYSCSCLSLQPEVGGLRPRSAPIVGGGTMGLVCFSTGGPNRARHHSLHSFLCILVGSLCVPSFLLVHSM